MVTVTPEGPFTSPVLPAPGPGRMRHQWASPAREGACSAALCPSASAPDWQGGGTLLVCGAPLCVPVSGITVAGVLKICYLHSFEVIDNKPIMC